MTKRSILKFVLPAAGFLGVASVAVHPSGAVKSEVSPAPFLTGAFTDPAVLAILQRSCQSCHSEKTEWPWYSYLAPMSWMIERDVRRGRDHLNLSRWDGYTIEEQEELLTKVGVMVRNRKMPLPKYTLLHPAAKLTRAEIDRIYQWSRTERRRLRTRNPLSSPPPG